MDPFSAYIPMDRRQALVLGQTLPDHMTGSVLFADVSGFTALTAALAEELGSRRGAEELTRQLNLVYGALIAQVHRYRGSVIGFSGDAITCWLNADNGLWATACALDMQQAMRQFAEVRTPAGTTVSLAIKVAVVNGPVRRFLVGDPQVRVIDILAGRTIEEMAAAEKEARRGEVVVGVSAEKRFGPANAFEVIEWRQNGRFALVGGLREEIVLKLRSMMSTVQGVGANISPWLDPTSLASNSSYMEQVTRWQVSEAEAEAWLLPPVYERLQRSQGQFLAELRPAVPLFLKFTGINYDQDKQAEAKLHAYVRWVQSLLTRYDGSLIQLTVGDKGSYLYAAFGAPIAYEDDPERAVAAGLALLNVPAKLDFIRSVQIGISQGRMRTGAYGSITRRTYGVLGNETNMAARLMGKAQPGQLIVSPHVAKAAKTYRFKDLGLITVKGRQEPIQVFEPLALGKGLLQTGVQSESGWMAGIVGRTAERQQVKAQVEALQKEGKSGVIIIEGEAGIGKSHLLEALISQAQALGVRTLVGAADAIEQSTPYYAWRSVLRRFFGLRETTIVSQRRQTVLTELAKEQYAERAPLLNPILSLDLAENELTKQMSGQVRADNTNLLLLHLLRMGTAESPLLVILDDAHWLDSASWALAALVCQQIQPLLLVVATRPLIDRQKQPYLDLIESPNTQHLRLDTLSGGEALGLVCQRLGVKSLPKPVASLIRQKAQGNPLFCEELAYALRDSGSIRIENETCLLTSKTGDLRAVNLPDTVEGVVRSRIDRLPPSEQLTLKVASIIGRIFPLKTLRAVYPVESEKAQLAGYLEQLQKLNLTELETPEPELSYIFKHIITQEVVYKLMLFAQRRQLHRLVAECYEGMNDRSPHYSLLAYHWQNAEAPLKAITYLEKAGDQALNNGAYQEGLDFFSQLLEIERQLDRETADYAPKTVHQPFSKSRRAHWERQLGVCYLGLGNLPTSKPYFEGALHLFGKPIPTTQVKLGISLLGQVTRQLAHRLLPKNFIGGKASEKEPFTEAALAYEQLAEIYYLDQQPVKTIYSTLRMLNLAEQAGSLPQMARGYASVCLAASLVPQPALAEMYRRRALETVRSIDDMPALSRTLMVIGLYHTGRGHWEHMSSSLIEGIDCCRELGDQRIEGICVNILGRGFCLQGRFNESLLSSKKLERVAQERDDILQETWALQIRAENKLCLGRFDDVINALEQSLLLIEKNSDQGAEIAAYGNLALAYLRRGEQEKAQTFADKTRQLIGCERPATFALYYSYASMTETYLTLWENEQNKAPGQPITRSSIPALSPLQIASRQACQQFDNYSKIFPIGQSRALLYRGCYEWLAGKPNRARQAWQKSLHAAKPLAMPYEEGLAHYHMGRHLPPDEPKRQQHLTRAIEIFERLDAKYDLKQAKWLQGVVLCLLCVFFRLAF